jgi:hypothetical protein
LNPLIVIHDNSIIGVICNNDAVAVATLSTRVYLVNPKMLTLIRIFTIDVIAWGISYVEDEYIAVDKGNISWIDPPTGRQIRELKTGFFDTRFASSYFTRVIER